MLEQIKQKIKQQKKYDPQLNELELSQIKIKKFTPQINKLFEKYKTQTLYLIDCGLTTLQNFPNIPTLKAIQLSKNKLGDDSNFAILGNLTNLQQLFCDGNEIKNLQTITSLSPKLQKLKAMSFLRNPVLEVQNYRKTIFQKFKQLQQLDQRDANGQPVPPKAEVDDGQQGSSQSSHSDSQQNQHAASDNSDEEDQYDGEDDYEQEQDQNQDYEVEDSSPPKKGGRKKK